mgnify:CR=1 FL=1
MRTKYFAVMWAGWGKRARFVRRTSRIPARVFVGPLYIRFGIWA